MLDVFTNLVRNLRLETFLHHLFLNLGPRRFIELVNCRADGTDLVVRNTGNREQAVEYLTVVDLDGNIAPKLKRLEYFNYYTVSRYRVSLGSNVLAKSKSH